MDFRDYLTVLRRRKAIIALCVVVVFATSIALTLRQKPVYQASAHVLIQPVATLFDTASGTQSLGAVRLSTEIQIFQSTPVQDIVRERLGAAPRPSVAQIGDTEVIEITVRSTDASKVAGIANTYAQAYVDYRLKQTVDNLVAAADLLRKKIDDLQKPIDDAAAALRAAAESTAPGMPPPSTAQRDALASQQSLYRAKLDNLQVDSSLKGGGAQVVSPAVTPSAPISPRKVHNGLLGLGVGIVIGLAGAFLVDHLDDSVKTADDLERAGSGVPIQGIIPGDTSWKDKREPRVVSIINPASPAAEAYRTLRTSINFLALEEKLKVVQITSPSSSEGKTTTLANLAVAMSTSGQSVIALDCDLRRPRLHEFFGLSNEFGFTSVLVGDAPLAEALQEVNHNLRVLTAGPVPPNPSELLSSHRAFELISALRPSADLILVDCPPVLPVTDAAALSSNVDGTLLVANARVTSAREVDHAMELLRRVNAPVIGAVLNGVTGGATYGYNYQYQYGRTHDNGRVSRPDLIQSSEATEA